MQIARIDGSIIEGPHIINETVEAGRDAIFHCQVNPEEHRSSTIRVSYVLMFSFFLCVYSINVFVKWKIFRNNRINYKR